MMDARYNAIWISDTHLCSRACRLNDLVRFVRRVRCRHLYLVGDILDLWLFRRRRYWPQELNNILRSLLGQTKHGTQVIYIPGNHDEAVSHFAGSTFGNIGIYSRAIHTTRDGRRLLVLHGHEVDKLIQYRKWLCKLTTSVQDYLISVERVINAAVRRLGLPPLRLTAPIGRKLENGVNPVNVFETAIAAHARRAGVDGVICGHSHSPAIKQIDGVTYCNCGDWTENCTAVAETEDGSLELLHWLEQPRAEYDGHDENHELTPGRQVLFVH
jgi:UDP-2,3-diacylglucosamine pyrophosphatase LpxH